MSSDVGSLLLYVTYVLQILIFIRVILSWLPMGQNPVSEFVFRLTEPLLAPLRRVLPRFGMMDLSPMILLIIILVVQQAIASAF